LLAQCPALAHLNLSGNEIGPAGAGRLAGLLTQCAALAQIDLRANAIGPAGAELLAGVLAQCPALAHLNLWGNQIGEAVFVICSTLQPWEVEGLGYRVEMCCVGQKAPNPDPLHLTMNGFF
jgi:Ran GTPase-activating protein (RanGAP) involved in mRNA processing and transport